MHAFILSLLGLVAFLGLLLGTDLLRDRIDGHSRFVGWVMLGCSMVLTLMITLLLIA
jgi:hypothetical protein